MRIGRAIEKSGNFDNARTTAALAGDMQTTDLTYEEKDVWLDSFVEKMGQAAPDEDAFFARRRQLMPALRSSFSRFQPIGIARP